MQHMNVCLQYISQPLAHSVVNTHFQGTIQFVSIFGLPQSTIVFDGTTGLFQQLVCGVLPGVTQKLVDGLIRNGMLSVGSLFNSVLQDRQSLCLWLNGSVSQIYPRIRGGWGCIGQLWNIIFV